MELEKRNNVSGRRDDGFGVLPEDLMGNDFSCGQEMVSTGSLGLQNAELLESSGNY